ncbi:hypothetical protein J1N35_037841 [Gossypium stocksii]|uniref:Reverse transcriptase zinc-binding domain-containing protein n=1 Tax=Gossypium stocksii TaxID=47602 RepID=A0A9D3ZM56_9ROSI|nr:hypothetical protein J1N35_037841 [Gossypium stocksii]
MGRSGGLITILDKLFFMMKKDYCVNRFKVVEGYWFSEQKILWEERIEIQIHDNNRVFSVKKLTKLLIKEGVADISFASDKIWKLNVPPRVRSFLWFWCHPSFGWVKFNVCGVESEDEVGCGGVLRHLDGVARALFSGPFAAKNSLVAEVGAVSMALDVYLAIGWKGKNSLIIEVGSIVVFNWVENKGLRPWLLFSFFKDVEIRLSRIGKVSFSKADKHSKKMAFALTVAGLERPSSGGEEGCSLTWQRGGGADGLGLLGF